ncbi:MAG TPA: DNA-protecting protein DprA [Deltaproteobacteria bacterium]|nr:DNA-protecting protein DprA [Deltaproteobacteria bacterium]
MDLQDARYWHALAMLRGVDRRSIAEAVKRAGGARELFESGAVVTERSGAWRLFGELAGYCDWERAEREVELVRRAGVRVVTLLDDEYPPFLREIYDPPLLLYVRGGRLDPSALVVAVVGTRRPTHYGLSMAEGIASELGRAGVVVVSGMARGCDSAAHRGALAGGGRTVAVLGSGVDVVYPKENRRLYEEICRGPGAVISEFPMGSPPVPRGFLQRNRIISGMARGVVVVEAAARSGAMQTARLALDAGRDVFAVPGRVTGGKSAGPHSLIKDGAALVENGGDVLSAYGMDAAGDTARDGREAEPGKEREGGEAARVLAALCDEPMHVDSIMEKTGIEVRRLSALLLEMELSGAIEQLPGKCFIRKVSSD